MKDLVYPKEKVYFIICLLFSIIFYLSMIISIVGIAYLIIFVIISLFIHGIFIGRIRGNGIKLSDDQFPEVYNIAKKLSNEMGLPQVPDIYIVESGGIINAFTTRFISRNFIILYTELMELAYEEGDDDALAFVICHELAHIKRKHLSRRGLLLPSKLIPFLNLAYYRACEYTCDSMAAYYVPEGAISGLLVLAAGKKLYRRVNVDVICHQANEAGFWVWLSEILSTHPNLAKRISFIQNKQLEFNYDNTNTYVSNA